MVQKRVFVEGRPLWAGVYNEPPDGWVAVGNAEGELLSATGDSEVSALENWRRKRSPSSLSEISRLGSATPVRVDPNEPAAE